MRLKTLFMAVAALLIVGAVGAQDKDPKRWETAKRNTEAMAKSVPMDDATKAKVIDIMYEREMAAAALRAKKGSLSEDEYKTENSAIYRTWTNDLNKVVPKEQRKALDKWRSLPPSERYKL